MKKSDYEKNHRICRELRKVLADAIYMPQPPNEYSRMLSSMLQQLHSIQGAYRKKKSNIPFKTLSVKQMNVIDKALVKYNKWLRRDSEDADFISNRNQQLKKLDTLLILCEEHRSAKNYHYNRRVAYSMKEQLMKRKILLTNKQKLLCNKMFKETKETG